ncbi:hypothetical protein SO802_015967 [Lithocarpus litseifolius]|uniref:Uncharacterized protein n=1 Tax=Lithocarpus litseifolius TaxID=425828 RepID=A0AAW2CVV4_9ROSI
MTGSVDGIRALNSGNRRRIPASKALVLASSDPSGASILLLRFASTLPSSSRIITPIPTTPCVEKTTPLTLTLNRGLGGGDYELFNSSMGTNAHGVANVVVYSAKYVLVWEIFN